MAIPKPSIIWIPCPSLIDTAPLVSFEGDPLAATEPKPVAVPVTLAVPVVFPLVVAREPPVFTRKLGNLSNTLQVEEEEEEEGSYGIQTTLPSLPTLTSAVILAESTPSGSSVGGPAKTLVVFLSALITYVEDASSGMNAYSFCGAEIVEERKKLAVFPCELGKEGE